MHRWTAITCAAVLGTLLAVPAQAQWKWRDKNGQTQYSDLPPPAGTPEASILQRPSVQRAAAPASAGSAASAAGLSARHASDPELEARRKQAEQEVADKKKADEARAAAARAETCSRAREPLRSYDSGERMARINDKGERVVIDDATRYAEIQRTRASIASDCR